MRYRRTGSPHIVRRIFGDDRARFESYVVRPGPDACHPWQGTPSPDGYGRIQIGGQPKLAHIVAWEFEHGPRPPGVQIDHECHNRAVREGTCQAGVCAHRLCCNSAHLVAKTPQRHKADTATWDCRTRGTKHANNVLTEKQVLEIKLILEGGERGIQRQLASQYRVSEALISAIKLGKAWSWLQLEP